MAGWSCRPAPGGGGDIDVGNEPIEFAVAVKVVDRGAHAVVVGGDASFLRCIAIADLPVLVWTVVDIEVGSREIRS